MDTERVELEKSLGRSHRKYPLGQEETEERWAELNHWSRRS